MANEAILRDRMSDPINFNCGETAMEKGTILKLSGPRGVGPTSADGDVVIGILAREKIAGDGRLTVPVFIDGLFDTAFIGPTVTQGSQVGISGPNQLKVFTAGDSEDGTVLGRVLETTTAGTNSRHQVIIGRGP